MKVTAKVVLGESEIEALGFSAAMLQEARRRGEAARNRVTPNHPPSYSGTVAWAEVTAALRELGAPIGCRKDDERNFSKVISADGKNAIVVVTGDSATGMVDQSPQPKYARGPATQGAVLLSQTDLFKSVEAGRLLAGPTIWFLLIRRDKEVAMAELSCPHAITESGLVAAWVKRIILPPLPVDPNPNMQNDPGETGDLDLDVTPRS